MLLRVLPFLLLLFPTSAHAQAFWTQDQTVTRLRMTQNFLIVGLENAFDTGNCGNMMKVAMHRSDLGDSFDAMAALVLSAAATGDLVGFQVNPPANCNGVEARVIQLSVDY